MIRRFRGGAETNKPTYSIAVIGAGKIGREITREAMPIEGLECILVTSPGHLEDHVREMKATFYSSKDHGTLLRPFWYESSDFQKHLNTAAISIVTIHNSQEIDPSKPIPQLDMIDANLGPIKNLAEKFRGYQGLVVVVTNPVEVLSYAFAQTAGLHPDQVVGFAHPDQTRARSAALEWILGNFPQELTESEEFQELKENIDCYIGGGHFRGARVPLYIKAGGLPLEMFQEHFDDIFAYVNARLETIGIDEMKREDTRFSTSTAMKELLEEAINGDGRRYLDLASYVRLEGREPIFMGMPTQIHRVISDGGIRFRAKPETQKYRPRFAADETRLVATYDLIEAKFKQTGVSPNTTDEAPVIGHVFRGDSKFVPLQRYQTDAHVYATTGTSIARWSVRRPNDLEEALQLGNHAWAMTKAQIGEETHLFAATRRKITQYNANEGRVVREWANPNPEKLKDPPAAHTIDYDPATNSVYWSRRNDGQVYRADLKTGKAELFGNPISGEPDSAGLVEAHGKRYLALSSRSGLHMIDLESRIERTFGFRTPEYRIESIATAGSIVYAQQGQGIIQAIDFGDPDAEQLYRSTNSPVSGIAVNQNGMQIALSAANQVAIYKPEDMEFIRKFRTPSDIKKIGFGSIGESPHLFVSFPEGDNWAINAYNLDSPVSTPTMVLRGAKTAIINFEVVP